ncbi:alkaline phosphatase family protein [Propionibacterium freudenreichii]|uniref:alkaline phosphatase family protein n=1 Tax=Propionibacterium freudenreichii TaxID=1744 RepID=UPI0005427318|nr:nucleotide pyrophosphatase/phosphodiesterase family protein [Propionibacterium freudenreichii]CEG94014.1 Type I phosphodiesterase / nucleotide pyrophosphatase [Propionibacterium freudenreichii]
MSGYPLPEPPSYGRATLAELLPAVAHHLAGDRLEATDPFGLPTARAYVLLLVDGLGWRQLNRHLSSLAYFPYLIGDGRPISAAVPSTTAVSLTTLGTGLPPGEHGIVGYSFRSAPGQGVLNALQWGSDDPVPEEFQPHPTWFERLNDVGVRASSVGRALFADSGLTRAGLRGAHYVAIPDHAGARERIDRVLAATSGPGPAFVYLYEGDLDHTGHGHGVDSPAWRGVLERIDADLSALRDALPADTCVLVTGDHGMVDVPARDHIIIEDDERLATGIDMIAGEGRFRQLYSAEPAAVVERWRAVLGERAWVCTREEGIAAGWFGPEVTERVRGRLGDVLVAMRAGGAVMTRTHPGELGLVGQHGSLTSEEMQVPLLIDEGWDS